VHIGSALRQENEQFDAVSHLLIEARDETRCRKSEGRVIHDDNLNHRSGTFPFPHGISG